MASVTSIVVGLAFASTAFCLSVSSANAIVLDMEGIAPSGGATTESTSRNMSGFNLYTGHGHYWDSAEPGVGSYRPDNGTDYFLHDNPNLMTLTKIGGGAFSIQSFDVSEWDSSHTRGNSVNVEGLISGGGSISTVFTTDNSFAFETFSFGAGWTNLASVTFQNANGRMAYDNIVVDAPTAVSEPGALAILGLGLAGLAFARRKRAA